MNKIFDKEYGTTFMKEVDYLKDQGIEYVFVKRDENNIRIYKYTKSNSLFDALARFYLTNSI